MPDDRPLPPDDTTLEFMRSRHAEGRLLDGTHTIDSLFARIDWAESPDFEDWLAQGERLGYCTPQFCLNHGRVPMTEAEEEMEEEGGDPCLHVVRLGTSKDWYNG